MPHQKQHEKKPQEVSKSDIEIQYTLDVESLETVKKLQKRAFDRLISKDLDIIKNHKIKKSKK